MKKFLYWVPAVALMVGSATARDLFSVAVTTGGVTVEQGTNDFRDVIEFIDDGDYQDINAIYNNSSIAAANYDLRGVAVSVVYPTIGPELTFQIPALGVSLSFVGVTRAASEDALLAFLEANGDDLLTRLLQLWVKESPVDPIAGNPNSLMSKMVAADFDLGTTVGPSNSFSASGDGDAPNLVGLGARFGHFAAGDFESNVVDLPFQYVMPLADPRYAVIFDVPLTYVEAEGASSYAGSLGVGMRLPIFDNWSVTPAARFGATGSVEIGGAAAMYSASLTSNFEYEMFGIDFVLGNGATFIQTLPLSFGDFELDYDLTNLVLRNGIGASGDTSFTLFGETLTWEAAVVNTQFFGDDLFVENSTDLSISFGTEASKNGLVWDSLRVGLTYTFTDSDFQGVRLNFGYQF